MDFYSISLTDIAIISSSKIKKVLPPRFSYSNKFNLSQNSPKLEDKSLVESPFGFEFMRGRAMIPGDLSNHLRGLSLERLLSEAFSSKYISFKTSTLNYLFDQLARSIM